MSMDKNKILQIRDTLFIAGLALCMFSIGQALFEIRDILRSTLGEVAVQASNTKPQPLHKL